LQLNATVADRWRDSTAGGLEAIDYGGTTTWSTPPRSIGHQMQGLTVDGVTTPYTTTQGCDGRVETALGMDFHYDGAGRLSYVTDENSATVKERYWYDAMGRLAAYEDLTTGGIGKRIFGYDGQQMISAVDGNDNPLWEAVWGAGQDELLAYYNHEMPTQDNYVTIRNHTNSVVGLHSTISDATVAMAEYNAEGRVKTYDPALGVPVCQEEGNPGTVCRGPENIAFGFNSMWRSPVSGLVYMRNRMYSPRLAEFISHDPLGYVDSFNAYQFAGFDSVNRWDPWGLDDEMHSVVSRGLSSRGVSSPVLEHMAKVSDLKVISEEDAKKLGGVQAGSFSDGVVTIRQSSWEGAKKYADGDEQYRNHFLVLVNELSHAAEEYYDFHPIRDDRQPDGSSAPYIKDAADIDDLEKRLENETLSDTMERMIRDRLIAADEFKNAKPSDRAASRQARFEQLTETMQTDGVNTYTRTFYGLRTDKIVKVPPKTLKKFEEFLFGPLPPEPARKSKSKPKPKPQNNGGCGAD
jgi:RHS repeat-associated protein